MARAIWSGAISFGLVNIPVELMGTQEEKELSFHMLDKADNSPIGYKKINKNTGKEVPAKRIVKGYEYEKGQYVIVTKEDFKRANPKATQTIDIEDFVEIADIDLLMFEKPYYVVPGKNGAKGYLLLREVMEQTGKAAVARIVLHSKQHLVALIPRGDYLILETLRFAEQVREVKEADFLDKAELAKYRVSPKELKMAQELVAGMTSRWKPEKYKDTYQSDLKKLIQRKVKSGDVEEINPVDEDAQSAESADNIVSLMPLLEKSLAAAGHGARSKKKSPAKKSAHAHKEHARASS